ncbi:rab proteins geranylgeranyltransferase component A 2 [Cimex lectularius]|uniref:Rab proteins geranylgeranyltransferase component A n=1 Tax=Cimex lectularius TaxID=79782 RepID=A0A8I6SF14_CIMLE|nr:rab proteins geranylgeranyltransferase component A 2 [Cimex lectularius]
MDELPTNFDVIIIGTGVVESIVSAAVSRIGKKVLHIDRNNYYGQSWGTFNIEHLLQWLDNFKVCKEASQTSNHDSNGEFKYKKIDYSNVISNVEYEWNTVETHKEESKECIKESPDDEESDKKSHDENKENGVVKTVLSEEKIKSLSRKFNLDITPKLILSKGPMVKLLLESEVSRYIEFLNVANILVYLDSQIEPVPYSKSDVFSSRAVNVVEKRILMRILTQIQEHKPENDKFEPYRDKTFFEFLQDQKLPVKITNQILYSIAMVTRETPCLEGVKNAQDFLSSLGFYGNSPFLWTMYGSSDLLQAFCRLSAVFGGIYCLDKATDELILDEENTCKGIVSCGKNLYCSHVVIAGNEIPSSFSSKTSFLKYNRAILITNKSLYKKGKNGVSLLQFPLFEQGKNTLKVIELDSTTCSCPKDTFVVHMISIKQDDTYDDLNFAIKCLFKNEDVETHEKPEIVFKCFFTIENTSYEFSNSIPHNVHPCSGPTPYDIDYHSSIEEAERIFKKMYPEEEFFGPLPPQEDEKVKEDNVISEDTEAL